MRPAPPLAAFVLALALVPWVASAQAPSFGVPRDQAWELEARHVTTSVGYRDFEVHSARNTTQGDDNWTLDFDGEGAVFTFTAAADRPDEARTQLTLRVPSLVEFQDHDGDGRLGLGDPIVQQLKVSPGSSWVETSQRQPGVFEAQVHLWMSGVRLDLDVRSTAEGTLGDGGSPTATTLAATVASFPYATDNRTYLALELRVDGDTVTAGDALASREGPLRSYLAWAPPRDAAGNATAMGVTLQQYLGDPSPQWLLVLSQPRHSVGPMHLAIGVARVPEQGLPEALREIVGDWRVYVAGILVAGIAIGWPVYRRLRGRPEGPA